MTELIQLLQEKAGITGEQATKSLHAIKEYVTTKFPMLAGAVDNMFASSADKAEEVKDKVAGAFAAVSENVKETAAEVKDDVKEAAAEVKAEVTGEEPGLLDKISDVIPGQTGQKIEDFAKDVADKAGDAYDSVKEKLGSFFGGKDGDEKKA